MNLPIRMPMEPMEAKTVDEIPANGNNDGGWLYEPKWDGFRCLAFRDGDDIALQSKAGKPLTRYFPDVVKALGAMKAKRFVLDGEIVVPMDGKLSFDGLLQRIHPAASRVRKLAAETPATFIAFDLLADADGESLLDEPLSQRRARLDTFAKKHIDKAERVELSPATTDVRQAKKWFRITNGGLDGVIAKRLDLPYRAGERDGMVKVKHYRTADCVVGGFRYASKGELVGSLLLGFYDAEGLLNHVGFSSSFKAKEREAMTRKIEKLRERGPKKKQENGFSGSAPGGPSRWSTERSTQWEPLPIELVVEVTYDHFSGGRFRHGTGFVRWRPDKSPEQCTFEQVEPAGKSALALL